MKKIFVKVLASFDIEGRIVPKTILWEDGHKYEIDSIIDVRQAASLKVGGIGKRYTCRICNKQAYLFYEEPRWFVEGK